MDIKAYIDSGILEQFVLGNTSPEETVKIIELSKSHPEIKAEIEAIEEGLFKFAQSFAKDPSADFKARVMAKIYAEENGTTGNQRELISEHNSDRNKGFKMYQFFIAASILLFGVSLVGNIVLYQKLKTSQSELASLNSRNILLTDNNKIQEANYLSIKAQMEIVKSPDMKTVPLKGLPLMPQAQALVYINSKNTEVYFSANTLPELSENEQYQLWAIVDGKPVDEGIIVSTDALAGVIKMKNIQNASAFAVTIEKKGGAINPSLEKMVLMGAVI